jgi:hypothetical protein
MALGGHGDTQAYQAVKELRVLMCETAVHLHRHNAATDASKKWACTLEGYVEVRIRNWLA